MNANHEKPPATMPALPLDVIVDILCRLPVKTLLCFRCLSKQFRSIIDDPDFINRHLQYHSLEQRLIVKGAYLNLLFLDLNAVDKTFKLEHPFENWGRGYGFGVHVIGSCDGLLALSNTHHNSIGLWNISTKKHRILPECLNDLDECSKKLRILPDECLDAKYGFGRDAANDDYKLVKIANFYITNVTQVSVYSLNANCWRRIDGFPPYSRYYLRDMAALVEGTLNWVGVLVDAEDRRKAFILSFDLKNEFFFEVSLPDTIGEIEEYELSVTVLGGCLCLLYHYLNHLVFDIWVMKEYGVKDSWTKLYWFSYAELLGIPEFPRCTKAFVYSKHGDKIFIFPNYGEAFQRDLEERKSEIVEINELPMDISSVSIYVESLVSPNVNN